MKDRDEIDRLRAELAARDARIAELYRGQKSQILSARSVECDIGTLQEEIDRLRADLIASQERVSVHADTITCLRAELASAQERISQHEADIDGLVMMRDDLRAVARRDAEEIARLREAGAAVIDAHDIVISTGSLGGPFKRHLEEPLWALRAALASRPEGKGEL